MAIQFVGRAGSSRAGATSTTTQSLTALTGGIDTAAREGDLVICTVAVGTQARNPTCAISGWTTIGTQLNVSSTTYDTSLQVSYKFMTSTPDTSITIPSTGNIADGQAWQVRVYRGVDATTPLDVAAVSATGTGTTRFDAPAITPTTAGAWIMIGGGGAASASTTALGTPSGFSGWGATNGADTNDGSCGAGYYSGWSSGSYNPAAPTTGGSVNAVNSWAAWTIALRPDPNQTLTPSLFTNSNSLALAHTVSGSGGGSGATYSTAGSGGSSVPATTQDTDAALVVPSGAVLYAIVQNSASTPADPSGVSLDPTGTPQAFTQIGTTIDNETYYKSSLWRLTNATGVTAVVRASWGGSQDERIICVWVGTGIDTTTPNGTVEQASAASTSNDMTDTIATTAGQMVLAFGAYQSQNVTQRTFNSPNGTERAEMTSDPDDYDGAAIQELVAAGSSTTPVWTISNESAQGWTMFTIALNDAGGGGSQNLTPSLFSNSNSLALAHTVTPGSVALTPSLFTNSNSLALAHAVHLGLTQASRFDNSASLAFAHTVTVGPAALTQTARFDNTASLAFGHTVTPGSVALSPALFSNTNSLAYAHTLVQSQGLTQATRFDNTASLALAHTVTAGAVALTQASRFDNSPALAFGHTVTPGAVTLSPGLYSNANALSYAHTVTPGATALTQTSRFDNTNSVAFAHTITTGAVALSPSLYTNVNTLSYTHTVTTGAVALTQSSRFNNSNSLAFGHTLDQQLILSPALFTNSHAYYTHVLGLYSQYPDPSEVLEGVIYGPPGSPLVGTLTATYDDTPKMDIHTGRMVKLISNTKVISL